MHKKERKQLSRLYELVGKVPFPASGSKSTTISGLAGFAEDMREFRPAFQKALFGILCQDIKEMYVDADYDDPDAIMGALEAWVAQRNKDDWNNKTLHFSSFYEQWKVEQSNAGETRPGDGWPYEEDFAHGFSTD